VTVSWIGNSTYEGFTNTTIWDVVKITSNSSIIVSNGKVGKSSSISGVVSDGGGNHLANAQISVTVDGHMYYVTTDSNGVWSLNIIPTTSGNLTVTVSWVGNITYNGFTNTTTLKVSKIVVKLTIIENGDGSIIIVANATYNDDDSPVVDYPVDFYLDNEKIGNNRTDNNGISTLTILSNKINNGQHKVKVIVLADNPINNAVAFAEFTKESNRTNNTNKTSNNLIFSAIMKKTGVPLNIVLVLLLTIFGFGICIKQKK
ncbi:carboxypeptidase-like regulatory domain-containing protein, partial [Methanobrevibacter sp. TMH8]|uniref:carboxypeptidase-like regulatory domain-containing protein n=1 Tax=Methanobrevibacter sp. TMH8 TaxID=2848611 RepID=UPI001CCA7435